MPLTEKQRLELIRRLTAVGWNADGSVITAPERSIWFPIDRPWEGDLLNFARIMDVRLSRLRRNAAPSSRSDSDTTSLVEVLREMVGPQVFDRHAAAHPPILAEGENQRISDLRRGLSFHNEINSSWSHFISIAAGNPTVRGRSPDYYLIVDRDDVPPTRIDIYLEHEPMKYKDALVTGRAILLAAGEEVHVVRGNDVRTFGLGSYFMHFFAHREFLLVASGVGILKFTPGLELAWQQLGLAVDGVQITGVDRDVIYVEVENDPPNGWRSIEVRLDTGVVVRGY